MSKRIVVLSVIFIFTKVHSQSWFDVGVKAGGGLSHLINQNIWDDNDYNHRLSSAYCFGAKIGYNLNKNHEFTFDVLFNSFRQSFLYNEMDSIAVNSPLLSASLNYSSISYLLMYRFNKEGRYSEIGTSFETLLSCSRTDENNSVSQISKEDLIQQWPSIVGGFGAYLLGTENFGITTGIRISYGLSDLISKSGKALLLPNFKNYPSYSGSYPLSIQFIIEANFDFAYVSKAQCNRRKLILF